ncbi:MAG TPA: hypothetical protein VGN51_01075 [Acidimicrobiia bacterium]|jgi:hypothetical protein
MQGPNIIAETLSVERPFGASGVMYQYHSRSDHHSKVTCWAIAFDLLLTSALLRDHARNGKVTFGINHTMPNFKLHKKKDLDLVIARPTGPQEADTPGTTLDELAMRYQVRLNEEQRALFEDLPEVRSAPVGSVLVALEAKACMTEHGKAGPRLFDELMSSQQTVHGAADQAVAVGLAMVNIAPTFISPGRQREGEQFVSHHKQPAAAAGVIKRLRELPRRAGPGEDGFDALGIMVIDLKNDGTPVSIWRDAPAPSDQDVDSYEAMVMRAAALYDYRFSAI